MRMQAQSTVSWVPESARYSLSLESLSNSEFRIKENKENQGLRQRKKDASSTGATSSPEPSDEKSAVKSKPRPDPLFWFGGPLSPQSLKAAQKEFKVGLDAMIQIANVQKELESLIEEYESKFLKNEVMDA